MKWQFWSPVMKHKEQSLWGTWHCLGQLQQGRGSFSVTHSAFQGSIIQRSENATKVCQVPFFDQISRLYWNHSMQHRFMFECIVSFLVVVCLFYEWSKEKLSWFFFKKTNQTSTISIFYYFCIYLVFFFFPSSLMNFVSFIWPNVLRRGNSFYHFWVIDY